MGYRYLVFGHDFYYPNGGMRDIQLKTNDLEEVKDFVKNWEDLSQGDKIENIHIFDLFEDRMIYKARFDDDDIHHIQPLDA